MLPDSQTPRFNSLCSTDFTDLLTATLSTVPRRHMIKFNNSWLVEEETETDLTCLIVYRAIAFKCVYTQSGLVFASSKPGHPGDVGTPWGHGWNVRPGGCATLEAIVPRERVGRFFDGIGIAKISLKKDEFGQTGGGITVLSDRIISNTDGYEDPRIFRWKDKIMVHAHRYHPDVPRCVADASAYVTKKQVKAGETFPEAIRLCMKVAELKTTSNGFRLENEFFYGLAKSQNIEKNFGFFSDQETLNAVYGVAFSEKTLTIMTEDKIDAPHISVNKVISKDKGDTCFHRIEKRCNAWFPIESAVMFSSSSPLIPTSRNRFLGVGHVKIAHKFPILMMTGALKKMREMLNLNPCARVSVDDFLGWMAKNPTTVEMTLREKVVQAAGLTELIKTDFFQSTLARLYAELVCQDREVLTCKLGDITRLDAPAQSYAFLHNIYTYLTYFYEIVQEGEDYHLRRFSDAFLLTELQSSVEGPCFLQFATGLARIKDGYLISYGENDHKCCVSMMSESKVETLLRHNADQFKSQDYAFYIEASKKVIL